MGVGPAGMRHHADDTEIVRWGLDRLARQVGGSAALDVLDDEPLPDEPFQWKGIPDDVVDRVQEVLDLTDRCCDQLLDVECRTASDACWAASPPPGRRCFVARDDRKPLQLPWSG